jgi:hypothetical protein
MEKTYLSQINELLDFLKEKSKRKVVLEALLGLTESEEMHNILLQTEVTKLMVRQLEDEDNEDRELVLQIIINLSGDERFAAQFVTLNTIHRIITLLMNKVSKEIKENLSDNYSLISEDKKNTIEIKMILDRYVIDSQSIKKDITGNFLEVPYFLMILTNLTIPEDGQKRFLNIEDENTIGVTFLKVLDKYFQYIYKDEFNFSSNLIANITSLKKGRELLLEYGLFKIFLIHFDKLNNHKMLNILRVVRNCCFEFETQKEEILAKDGMLFNFLIKILILTNITDKKELQQVGISNIDEIYYPNFSIELAILEKETINDLIVDIFLILTNLPDAVIHMKEKDLYKALKIIGDRLGTGESLKDRLFVINNYLEY